MNLGSVRFYHPFMRKCFDNTVLLKQSAYIYRGQFSVDIVVVFTLVVRLMRMHHIQFMCLFILYKPKAVLSILLSI